MEDKKQARKDILKTQKNAIDLIKKKGELTLEKFKNFTVAEINVLLKWKRVKGESTRKKDIVDAYVAAPKPKPVTIWKRAEESELKKLKDELMPIKDTALGVATNQMARAVVLNIDNLQKEELDSLKSAIQKWEDSPAGTRE